MPIYRSFWTMIGRFETRLADDGDEPEDAP